jgi:hypothetical protein
MLRPSRRRISTGHSLHQRDMGWETTADSVRPGDEVARNPPAVLAADGFLAGKTTNREGEWQRA